jgi:hypothetical protein
MWRAVYAPGDGQTSPAYSSKSVQYLYINHLLSVHNLVLSYLLLRLLSQLHVYEFRYVQIVENFPICGYIHSKGIPAEKNNTEHYIHFV